MSIFIEIVSEQITYFVFKHALLITLALVFKMTAFFNPSVSGLQEKKKKKLFGVAIKFTLFCEIFV